MLEAPHRSLLQALHQGLLQSTVQDLRAATRFFRRRPALALLATGTLGVGIGACTLFFSLADALLLRPLPFAEPERLVELWNRYGEGRASLSPPDYVDRRDRARTLASSAAFARVAVGLAGAGDPRQVVAHRVTRAFFDVLGVAPALGRVVFPAEEGEDPGDTVVLSHTLWATAFGADPAAIGRQLRVDGLPHTIEAVMPPGLDFPAGTDVWLPLVFTPEQLADDNRGNENLGMVARLAPGATLEGARAELESIAAGVLERVPERAEFLRRTGWDSDIDTLASALLGGSRPLLGRLALAVALVLLVACVNVAHLQLNLASARAHEMGLRACLGAGRRRLVGQLVAESLVLGATGALLGIGFAALGARVLPHWLPDDLPRVGSVALDPRAIAVGAGLAILASLAVALVPAWMSARAGRLPDRQAGLGARSPRALRRALVASEVALAVLLLALAGLLLRGFERLRDVDPGFVTESRLSFRVRLPPASFPSRESRIAFSAALRERLGALPEMDRVAVTDRIPLEDRVWTGTFRPEGFDPGSGAAPPGAALNFATPGLFASLGIPLLAGRELAETDTQEAPQVLVVDQLTADRYFPAGAVGRRISFAQEPSAGDWYEIVGVVGHVSIGTLDERPAPQLYLPATQLGPRELAFVIHSSVDAESLLPRIRAEVAALAPDLPVYDVRTLDAIHAGALALARTQASAIALFAMIAVLLAAVGIYGVLALSVAERTREIGLRMALGASAGRVARQVLGEALALVAIGTVLGLGLTRLVAGILEGALYGLDATDATTFALVVAVCGLGAGLLAAVPARRAARVDPMAALRAE
jgi:predicted permease